MPLFVAAEAMETGPLKRYRAMIELGELELDPAQLLAAEKLQLLANRLAQYEPPSRTDFFSYFTRQRGELPEGLYMFGGVGRGKTMLMDLFYETVPFAAKARVHFHEFMVDAHERIGRARNSHDGDPISHVADAIAQETQLLCFDELHVTDIADAMILGRLFQGLFDGHVVMVATSNTAPWELYHNGLNRPLFEPFVELVERRMEVLELEAEKDYRLEKLQGRELYFTPSGKKADKALAEVWRRLTGRNHGRADELIVKGRKIHVPEACYGIARFGFDDLCGKPLGAADYLRVAHAFHTVLLSDIPVMGPERRNEARRFINLIDTFYDQGVRLVASADAEPEQLYVSGDGAKLFERTASRLLEMRSEAYLAGKEPRAA